MTVQSDERDRIRATLEGRSGAIQVKSVEQTLSYYGPEVVAFTLAPPLRDRRPPADGLAGWFETWSGAIGHEVRELSVDAAGDVAFCTSLNHMTGTKKDGEAVDLWFRATYGLRKLAGRWLIVHEHESVPFYMDGSYRAAVDLRP